MILKLDDIHTYYGSSYVLQGVSLTIQEGTVVALLGRNGMGKTTMIRSIMGFTPPSRGTIHFRDKNISNLQPNTIAKMGMGYVPQGRFIFPSLTVEENLTMAARSNNKDTAWTLEQIYAFFPILHTRASIMGTLLSGGEQQMLAIGRALMTNPHLILMDEPSEGLSPKLVQEVLAIIKTIKQSGISILLIEQNIAMALALADYVYVINKGVIVHVCKPEEFTANEEINKKYLF